ncbi:MAG: (d)CMP kinase, partial [Puniceicoccales bacterium]|nr:(d)CMP kinase [Puniceicoccales bacterium]
MSMCLPLLLLLLVPAKFLSAAIDYGAFTTYGSFEDLRLEHELQVMDELFGAPNRLTPNGSDFVTVAIDGAAGSGKTSTAKALAERCGFAFASTGEHYRVLARLFIDEGIGAADEAAMARRLIALRPSTIFTGNCAHIAFSGRIYGEDRLRSAEVNGAVSKYAAVAALRNFLCSYQRQLPAIAMAAGFRGIVLEGRDVTSVVFPDADLRAYLHVDVDERKRRRAGEGLV